MGGDPAIARECMEETLILRKIVPQALEYNKGFFVAVTEEDLGYRETFLEGCARAGIPAREVPVQRVLAREPRVNPAILAAVEVPDGTIDAFRLVLPFFEAARRRGAEILPWREVTGFLGTDGHPVEVLSDRGEPVSSPPELSGIEVKDRRSGEKIQIRGDYFINAAGPWAGQVAALAGRRLPITPAPGTMVAVKGRLCRGVISRLRPPADGDILVPQRRLTIIGSTQYQTEDPDQSQTPLEDRLRLFREAEAMMPGFSQTPFQAAWSAPRPLLGHSSSIEEGRDLSRDFDTLAEGNLISIIGGKATVLRAMGEKAADHLCRLAGVEEDCRTRETILPSHRRLYQRSLT